jgi:predicted enzyme related to lactoylglutathione lyase
MGERTEYAPGTPSWTDVTAPDIDAAARFYGAVMGWEAQEAGPPEETAGYRLFTVGGRRVAGIGPVQGDGPPMWTTYITVDDADATAGKVAELGGQVLLEPMDVMDQGRMAVFMDPIGTVFAVWEPGATIGAELVNEPGAMCWNEVDAPNADEVIPFYTALFGWEAEATEMGGMPYTLFKLGGRNVGGATKAEGPPNWGVSFNVTDTDATVEAAKEHGGRVLLDATDIPIGRFAVLADPHGAVFGVIKLDQPDP